MQDHRPSNDHPAAQVRHDHETPAGDAVDTKGRFDCPHCDKSYATKKSLTVSPSHLTCHLLTYSQRHVNSKETACMKQRSTKEETAEYQPKPRWICSRCNKDYVSCATADVCPASMY